MGRRARHDLTKNLTLSVATIIRRDLTNPEFLPEDWQICAPYQASQTLEHAPERWAPKMSVFEN